MRGWVRAFYTDLEIVIVDAILTETRAILKENLQKKMGKIPEKDLNESLDGLQRGGVLESYKVEHIPEPESNL